MALEQFDDDEIKCIFSWYHDEPAKNKTNDITDMRRMLSAMYKGAVNGNLLLRAWREYLDSIKPRQ